MIPSGGVPFPDTFFGRDRPARVDFVRLVCDLNLNEIGFLIEF